jgi:MoxR-like ATPase
VSFAGNPDQPLVPAFAFSAEDCAIFDRYPQKVPFKEENVPAGDKAHFKSIWERLKGLATWLAVSADVDVPLRAEASSYSQNGWSQTDLWSCVYPESAPNKSYALQVAIIISARGAELCLCLGAGQSQLSDPAKKQNAELALAHLKDVLKATPPNVRRAVSRKLDPDWQFRRRWREAPGTADFANLGSWLTHAASPEGNGASISRNFTAAQVEDLGTDIGYELIELADAFAPLISYAYGGSEGAPAGARKPPPAKRSTTASKQPDLGELAASLYVDVAFLDEIVSMLKEKRQVIFYGPPGTGKTYVAQQLLKALAPDEQQREIVQFHSNYSYEDFVLGFRPFLTDDKQLAYALQHGPLMRLAERASANPRRQFLLLIDEINRGNLPRIFGELLYLLEYRGERISLMYAPGQEARVPGDPIDEQGRFALPSNLLLLGTMNTADRSIGLIDAALRRRFHFVPFFPDEGPLKGLLARWLGATQTKDMQALASWVTRLNELLAERFGRHLQVGHSYFMRPRLKLADVQRIWAADIMPFLEDQLFGQEEELKQYTLEAIRKTAAQAPAASDPLDRDPVGEHAHDSPN